MKFTTSRYFADLQFFYFIFLYDFWVQYLSCITTADNFTLLLLEYIVSVPLNEITSCQKQTNFIDTANYFNIVLQLLREPAQ